MGCTGKTKTLTHSPDLLLLLRLLMNVLLSYSSSQVLVSFTFLPEMRGKTCSFASPLSARMHAYAAAAAAVLTVWFKNCCTKEVKVPQPALHNCDVNKGLRNKAHGLRNSVHGLRNVCSNSLVFLINRSF